MVAFTESPQLVHISKIITPSIMTKYKQLILAKTLQQEFKVQNGCYIYHVGANH